MGKFWETSRWLTIYCWNIESRRYFGEMGLKVQADRRVPLLPKVVRDAVRAELVGVVLGLLGFSFASIVDLLRVKDSICMALNKHQIHNSSLASYIKRFF